MYGNVRQEMTEIMLPGPCNGFAPTVFRRLSDDRIKDFKRKIILCLKGRKCLRRAKQTGVRHSMTGSLTVFIAVILDTLGSVNTPT
jgi:hypothetical protein